jgi:hypothetical protein
VNNPKIVLIMKKEVVRGAERTDGYSNDDSKKNG